MGVPELAWSKKNLEVCWQTDLEQLSKDVGGWTLSNSQATPAPASLQKEVRDVIQATYTPGRLGIAFTGFSHCPSGPKSLDRYSVYLVNNVLLPGDPQGVSVTGDQNKIKMPRNSFLFLTDFTPNPEWKAGVGFNLDEDSRSARKYLKKLRLSLENAMALKSGEKNSLQDRKMIKDTFLRAGVSLERDARKFTILHEFGHLLGLVHEDRRHDSGIYRPGYCLNYSEDFDRENDGTMGREESRFGTAYDPFSIMSYCRATMHDLYRQAEIVCRLAPMIRTRIIDAKRLSEKNRSLVSNFLNECKRLPSLPFPLDITARDLNSLEQMYRGKTSNRPEAIDYHASPRETKLSELFEKVFRLPFVSTL